MYSREQLQRQLTNHPLVTSRLDTLRLAAEINPAFRDPHITGGYLRNILLGVEPNDCDVVFKGIMINQPGITEVVQQAEAMLNIKPYPNWEFENSSATGYSGNFYDDNIGKYSYHTDYLTMIMMDTSNKLHLGQNCRTLQDLSSRTYDLYFPGIRMWAIHRGRGRSYLSCLTGDLIRGLYLCTSLKLAPSSAVEKLFNIFDDIYNSLDSQDQANRQTFWLKKTNADIIYKPILDKYSVKSLVIN